MIKLKPTLLPAIAWLIISTFLLTIPGNKFPTDNWLDKIWADKWVHIAMFAIMVFLFCWGLINRQYIQKSLLNSFLLIAFISFAYGITMEFVQRDLVSNRSFDMGDIVADGIGCLIGLLYSIRKFGGIHQSRI